MVSIKTHVGFHFPVSSSSKDLDLPSKSLPTAQKFFAESARTPEPGDVEVDTAEELVIRYVDMSQIERLRRHESFAEGMTSPVGVLVLDRHTVEPRTEPPCTVTFSLGSSDDARGSGEESPSADASETTFTITEESGW